MQNRDKPFKTSSTGESRLQPTGSVETSEEEPTALSAAVDTHADISIPQENNTISYE